MNNRIQELREARELTQEQLAANIQTSRRMVGSWESGKARPYGARLRRLSEFFGVPPEEIFPAIPETSFEFVGYRECMARIRALLGRVPRYKLWCELVDSGEIPSYPDPFRKSCNGAQVRLYRWEEVKAKLLARMRVNQ